MKRNMKRNLSTGALVLALTASSLHGVEAKTATIRLNCKTKTLTKGSNCKLNVKGTSKKVTWKSSNKKVATVNKKGKVTAKKVGKATITATCSKKKMICKIIVKKPTTQKPSVPSSTSTPSPSVPTTTPNTPSSSVTEASAYATLNSLRSTYPQGMRLTNSYYYYSPRFGNGYGCYGFAAKLSDTLFGTEKAYPAHSDFSRIKVGDNIRIGNYHSVIVLTKSSNYITVVEGNYNSSVNWDRKITASALANDGFKVYTRY